MEIVLVRHGQTEWNVQEIFRGQADIRLNDTGRKQAELLGEFLRQPGIEAVYCADGRPPPRHRVTGHRWT